jgi:hypothetical protein
MLLPPAATRLIIVLVVLAVRNLPGRLATALARSLLHVGCTGYRVLIDRFARSALSAWELDCHALVDHHIAGQPPSWVIREYPLITGSVSPIGHVAGTRGSIGALGHLGISDRLGSADGHPVRSSDDRLGSDRG